MESRTEMLRRHGLAEFRVVGVLSRVHPGCGRAWLRVGSRGETMIKGQAADLALLQEGELLEVVGEIRVMKGSWLLVGWSFDRVEELAGQAV